MIEAKCYRFLSHTTDDDDRTYRSREEVDGKRRHDPLPAFEQILLERGVVTPANIDEMRAELGLKSIKR